MEWSENCHLCESPVTYSKRTKAYFARCAKCGWRGIVSIVSVDAHLKKSKGK